MIDEKNQPELPESWVWSSLGDICLKAQYGWTTKASKEGNIHLLRTTDITSGNIDWNSVPYCEKEPPDIEKYLVKDGDIVVSRAGSVGYSHLIRNPQRAVFASYLIRFNPLINEKYVAYFLKSPFYWQSISEKSIGIALPNVNATKLKQINIPIPPLPEQHRIVSKIEELFTKLDAGVKSLKRTRVQLERYRRSTLQNAFTGKLEYQNHYVKRMDRNYLLSSIKKSHCLVVEKRRNSGKRNYADLEQIDYKQLPNIPKWWAWARLEEVVLVIDYRGRTPPYSSEGIPNLRSSNIRNGKIIWEDLKYISKKTYQKYMIRGLPKKGDLLFTTEAPLGEVAFVPEIKFSVAQRVILLRPNEGLLDSAFLYYQIMSERFQRRLKGRGTGTTVTGVSYRNFRNLELVIPPIDEQKMIVNEINRRFSIMEQTEKAVKQSLSQTDKLRWSILKKVFEGRFVSQDPSDEPAWKLLERIKREKARLEAERKTRRRPKTGKRPHASTTLRFKMDPKQKRLIQW